MTTFVSCGGYVRFSHVVSTTLRYVHPADISDVRLRKRCSGFDPQETPMASA
jgi:hypothetical protein